eukprot:IDg988t1
MGEGYPPPTQASSRCEVRSSDVVRAHRSFRRYAGHGSVIGGTYSVRAQHTTPHAQVLTSPSSLERSSPRLASAAFELTRAPRCRYHQSCGRTALHEGEKDLCVILLQIAHTHTQARHDAAEGKTL